MTELHVIFGMGPLGRYTAESLLVLGKSVRMVNRSGKMVDAPAGVEIVASNAYDVTRNIEVTPGAAARIPMRATALPRMAREIPTVAARHFASR